VTLDLDALYDNRSDPDARMVLEDLERSSYDRSTVCRLGFALSFIAAAAAAAAADDAAPDTAPDYADADGDDADADHTLSDHTLSRSLLEEPNMETGLHLIQISVTHYRALTIIGWLRRVRGDEYELVPGARIITRKSGESADWNGFDDIASKGVGKKYKAHPAMKAPETLHRLIIKRSKPADEKVWAKECPRPEGWAGEH
jgi:hypothetical protein